MVNEYQRGALKRCTTLGTVESGYFSGERIVADGALDDSARRRMREEAAKRGANVVMLTYQRLGTSEGRILHGEAFSCPAIAG
jgi:hypothetical protein